MKAPAAVSPFTAKSSQEQKEQWIWWQCQQTASTPLEDEPLTSSRMSQVPELELPGQQPQPRQEEKPPEVPQRKPIRHSQYDAVVRRMQNATQQARAYTSVKR